MMEGWSIKDLAPFCPQCNGQQSSVKVNILRARSHHFAKMKMDIKMDQDNVRDAKEIFSRVGPFRDFLVS